MDDKVFRYRKNHKKCKYCKYYHVDGAIQLGIVYDHCKAKDTIIYNIDIPRWFCSCYEVKNEF